MKITILGAGNVGTTLGRGFAAAGHTITYGVRAPDDPKHDPLRDAGARVLDIRGAVVDAEVVVLATPWNATQAVLEAAGDFDGKPLVDATNPLGPGLTLTLGLTDSGGEQVARWAKGAKVVKAFNTTGLENMANPRYGAHRAAMFVCGDDDGARAIAGGLAGDLGFDAIGVGPLARARVLEPVAKLWIDLAMVRGYGRGIALGLLTRSGAPTAPAGGAPASKAAAIAIIGNGHIGAGLARAWARRGHRVVFGSRRPDDAELRALATELGVATATIADAVASAEVVVIAAPYAALDDVLAATGPLVGKIVIDCTNAVGRGMTLQLGHTTSAAEALQQRLPGAYVFKSFNAQGAENLAAPIYDGVAASNFFCGDDPGAREVVRGLVADVGFDPVDAGPLRNAQVLEPLMVLWVLASQARGTRDLAFALWRR